MLHISFISLFSPFKVEDSNFSGAFVSLRHFFFTHIWNTIESNVLEVAIFLPCHFLSFLFTYLFIYLRIYLFIYLFLASLLSFQDTAAIDVCAKFPTSTNWPASSLIYSPALRSLFFQKQSVPTVSGKGERSPVVVN